MKTVGMITTGVAGVVVLVALAVGIRSIPDMRRYIKIRTM